MVYVLLDCYYWLLPSLFDLRCAPEIRWYKISPKKRRTTRPARKMAPRKMAAVWRPPRTMESKLMVEEPSPEVPGSLVKAELIARLLVQHMC